MNASDPLQEPSDFAVLAVPARIANLGFRIALPRDWNPADLPPEEVDFGAPSSFYPLLVATAPGMPVVLTVAARPGFEDGTLQDWSLFLLDSQGIRPTEFGPAAIGELRGLAGVGRQQQDETWLEVRFAFLEDGGRLVHLGLLAPEGIGPAMEPVWQTALRNFALESPQGQNTPVGPGEGVMPAAFADSDMGFYAKADDGGTLDPEHPLNARLRDQGVGLVPRVLETDVAARTAMLGAGAIDSRIQVALGWHVIDDGRRTLLLDPDGKIQISLNLVRPEGRGDDEILDEIEAELTASYPGVETIRLRDGETWGLAARGMVVDGEAVEQVHMLTAAEGEALLRARVTADPASMAFAANYAGLILQSANS